MLLPTCCSTTRWKNWTSNPSKVNDRETGKPRMRVPPRTRKYSANCGFVMQNPVSWKQFACASVSRPGGAKADTSPMTRNPTRTAIRFITTLSTSVLRGLLSPTTRTPTPSSSLPHPYQLSSRSPVLSCPRSRTASRSYSDLRRLWQSETVRRVKRFVNVTPARIVDHSVAKTAPKPSPRRSGPGPERPPGPGTRRIVDSITGSSSSSRSRRPGPSPSSA